MKILKLAFLLYFLSGCTTINKSSDSNKLKYHRYIAGNQINFNMKNKFKIYIISKTIIMKENTLSNNGKAILKEIIKYHKRKGFSKLRIISHSTSLKEKPQIQSQINSSEIIFFLKQNGINNIDFINKGDTSPLYHSKSYNEKSLNERFELLFFK